MLPDGGFHFALISYMECEDPDGPSTACTQLAHLWQTTGGSVSTLPTIPAWDWTAIRRILPLEANSP